MIVFGGVSRGGSATDLSDGAAFDPATRTWRTIAAAPPGVRGDADRGAAWTGTSAIFWAGNSPNGPAAGGVYEPRSDSWTRLPHGPLGPREGYSSVWTGKELLLVGGTSGDTIATPSAAAIDPKTGKWRLLPALDKVKGLQATDTVWDGRRAFVFGSRSLCPELGSACAKAEPFFATYDPTTDALQPIDLGNAPAAGILDQLDPIAWTGSSVLFATSGTRTVDVVTYDPSAARWRRGRAAPCALPDPSYAERAWIGNRFVTACGADGLQLYSPATDTWRVMRPGGSTMNSRAAGAIAWTGTSLIAWSGTVKEPGNPTPADGASITLGP
jgi:hypothetical protein